MTAEPPPTSVSLVARLERAWRREHGVTVIEYALIAALIAVAIAAAVRAVGVEASKSYQAVGKGIATP